MYVNNDLGLGAVVGFAVAGYVFLTQFHLTKDRVSRLGGGYEVLFLSAAFGFVGVALSPVVYELSAPIAAWLGIDHAMEPLFRTQDKSAHAVPPYVDQIAAAVVGAWALAVALNHLPGMDWYRKRALRRSAVNRGDLIEVLLYDALRTRAWVELALKSGKSYIGAPISSPLMATDDADIEVVPVFSGYRSDPNQVLVLVRYYGDIIEQVLETPNRSLADLRVVIPARRIAAARPFDLDVYRRFNPGESVA